MSATPDNEARSTAFSREIAELDALLNAKQSFASRIGLLPFAAGVVAALTTMLVFQFASHV